MTERTRLVTHMLRRSWSRAVSGLGRLAFQMRGSPASQSGMVDLSGVTAPGDIPGTTCAHPVL